MQSRLMPVMRIVTIVLVIAIGIVLFLTLRHLFTNDRTPRTQLERAVYAAEDAVRATPEDAAARIKLAAAYLEAGSLVYAREQAEIAVRLAPADPAAYYILGLVQARQGDNGAAIESYLRAVGMEGQMAAFYQDVWTALSVAYEREGDTESALDAVNRALSYGPENALLVTRRAEIYEHDESWAEALYDYYLATRFVPDHAPALEGIERLSRDHPDIAAEVRARVDADFTGGMESTTTP